MGLQVTVWASISNFQSYLVRDILHRPDREVQLRGDFVHPLQQRQ
jgi:hypothetical protein